MPTGPDLVARTKAAMDLFNSAKTTHKYDGLQAFLCDQVTIHRVDDATTLHGSPECIVQSLNTTQVDKWPQLVCNDFAVSPRSPVVVLGTGEYCDDIRYPTIKIPVRCSYHFEGDKINVAFAVPYSGKKQKWPWPISLLWG